jgi:Cu(I)/Ag(I) efflux system membrane fusion protein
MSDNPEIYTMKSDVKSVLLATIVGLVTFSCGDKQPSQEKESAQTSPDLAAVSKPQFEVDPAFQSQLATLFNSYASLKEAFVSSDAAKVVAEATLTAQKLGEVNAALPEGAARNDWEVYRAALGASLAEMITSGDIEAQRKSFSGLSDALYKSVRAYGLGGTVAYYQFCPMAFNDEGGYWLSDEKKVRNPYFGAKMLSCGVVKETLN